MAAGLYNPASMRCWPLSYSANHKSHAAVHSEFMRSTHTWRHNEYLWLTSRRFCLRKKKVWWCGFSLSLAQLAQAISSSPISSDVLLSDATIVFVLDIVLALIMNCSNYSWALSFPLETMLRNRRSRCVHKQRHRGLQYVGAPARG